MRLAYEGVAQVLFDAVALTQEVLDVDLPIFIWDCAVAGRWWHLASEQPTEVFSERIGHYWFWKDHGDSWRHLFRAESSGWQARLLERSAQFKPDTIEQRPTVVTENRSERQNPRKSIPPASKTGKRRGRRPNPERRDAIRKAINKHGEKWRDHLSEIFTALDAQEVPLGDFHDITIELGDSKNSRASCWADLDFAEGDQRKQIIDSLRKYLN
jgi:hypothetical protein